MLAKSPAPAGPQLKLADDELPDAPNHEGKIPRSGGAAIETAKIDSILSKLERQNPPLRRGRN